MIVACVQLLVKMTYVIVFSWRL